MTAAAVIELIGLLMSLATQVPSAIDAVETVIKHIEAWMNGTEITVEDKATLLSKIQAAKDSLPKPA